MIRSVGRRTTVGSVRPDDDEDDEKEEEEEEGRRPRRFRAVAAAVARRLVSVVRRRFRLTEVGGGGGRRRRSLLRGLGAFVLLAWALAAPSPSLGGDGGGLRRRRRRRPRSCLLLDVEGAIVAVDASRRNRTKSWTAVGAAALRYPFEKSGEYDRIGRAKSFERDNCVAIQPEWQKAYRPTCNSLHESDLGGRDRRTAAILVNNGDYRDVWGVVVESDSGTSSVAVKTLRYAQTFDASSFEHHRRDAMATEHLTSSPYVSNIYGHCVTSSIYDYSEEGSVKRIARSGKLKPLEKLKLCVRVASAVADVHNLPADDPSLPPLIAHSDVSAGQFVFFDSTEEDDDDGEGEPELKLNDFNLANFLTWNDDTHAPCEFYTGNDAGYCRSPEEYRKSNLTHAIDTFGMGNVLHYVLTGGYPHSDAKNRNDNFEFVTTGRYPPEMKRVREGGDPIEVAIVEAIEMTTAVEPKERKPAREVATFLAGHLDQFEKNASKPRRRR